MSRTYRRKSLSLHIWVKNLWSDHRFKQAYKETPNAPSTRALYHQDWNYIPHHPPAQIRRQIEHRYRARLSQDLRRQVMGEQEHLTPLRFAKGIGWFWNW